MRDTELLRTDRFRAARALRRPPESRVPPSNVLQQRATPNAMSSSRHGPDIWVSSLEAWPASGGGLLLGMAVQSLAGDVPCRAAIKTAFLRVDSGGSPTVIIPYVRLEKETAQCVATVVATELDVPPELIAVDQETVARSGLHAGRPPLADLDTECERSLGMLAAAACMLMVGAAAENWSIDPAGCYAAGGAILDPTQGRSVTFAEIVQDAVLQDLPPSVRLRSGATLSRFEGRQAGHSDRDCHTSR
jgi:isoquinoline 1-oxidoreductase beta subunit